MDELQESDKTDATGDGVDVKSNQTPISTKELEDTISKQSITDNKEESNAFVKMNEDINSSPGTTIETGNSQTVDANVHSASESVTSNETKESSTTDSNECTPAVELDEDVDSSTTASTSNVSSASNTEKENTSVDNVLTNEHTYASISPNNSEKSVASSNVDNTSYDLLSTPRQSTSDSMVNSNDTSLVTEEIFLSEETIIENNEYNAYVNKQNIKNTNLSNELASHDIARDMFYIDKQTSLAAIAAQYDSSDSENEDGENAEVIDNKDYRNKEIVLLSDDTSDSDSDSSSSDSDDNDDKNSKKSKKSDKSDDESDEEAQAKSNKNRQKKMVKHKSEFDDLPPIEDLTISVPEVLCDPLGEVAWTVEQMVVVKPKPGKPTLNLDTVLFIDKGKRALGRIFDVFGQVAEPHYCVRFNSSEHIQERDIKVGMTVYYGPNTPYTSLVFLSELTKMKAVDDLEEDDAPQFSDDEEEQAYLASLKKKPSEGASKPKETPVTPAKRKRGNKPGWQSNHPWNSNREQQSHSHAQPPRPFYQTHHPWSRPRYQPPNPWYQYNSFPHNQWMPPPHPSYNQMPAYNYLHPGQVQPIEMQNIGYPPVQWNAQYQLPPVNPAQFQPFQQTMMPPMNLPPPPPPPSNSDT